MQLLLSDNFFTKLEIATNNTVQGSTKIWSEARKPEARKTEKKT